MRERKRVGVVAAVGLLAGLLAPQPATSAQAADAPLNAAAPLAVNVPSSVLAAAGPNGLAGARLGAAQAFDWRFVDAAYAAVSGSSTATPVSPTTLSPADQAAWEALTKNFTAPATTGTAVSKVVGGANVAVIGLTIGLLAGNAIVRLAGFKDNDVCSQQSDGLTALSSLLNNVDCTAYKNAMTATQRDADQVPVSTMDPMTSHGITVKYLYGQPWPGTSDYNLLTCFTYTGQSDAGFQFRGVKVYGANSTSNQTGSSLNNDNCRRESNLSGWWVTAPLLQYKLIFTDPSTGAVSYSPVASGTYSTPHPQRTFQCVLTLSGNGAVDASSSTFTEQDATLGGVTCPPVPSGYSVTGFRVNEVTNGDASNLLSVSTTTAYQQWIAAHPECKNGSCLTDLRKDGVSCFRQVTASACAGWFTSSTRASHYTCFEGTRSVALNECFVYAPTFDGTNADDGHGYGDAGTGATQAPQTTPTKRQRLAKVCKAYLAQVPASGVSTIGAVAGVSTSECDTMPIYLPGADLHSATDHRVARISGRPAWVRLNYESSTDKTTDVKAASGLSTPRSWYSKTTTCGGTPPTGQSCDEFPNWSMLQGAKVRSWSDSPLQEAVGLKVLATVDNTAEGSWYGRFVQNTAAGCKLTSATAANPTAKGSEFLEIPGMLRQTEYICGAQ